ncbi:MAG: class I SAM-dependent methyltransferase [Chloroflexota bacterium]
MLAQCPCPRLALELGCGDRVETASYLARVCPSARLVSLDIDLSALRTASRTSSQPSGSILVQGDITRLPLRTHFDLIIVRHPDLDRHPADWEQALTATPDWLTTQGILLITLYSIAEVEQVRRWVSPLPFAPMTFAEDLLAAPGLSGRDRFFLCYRDLL